MSSQPHRQLPPSNVSTLSRAGSKPPLTIASDALRSPVTRMHKWWFGGSISAYVTRFSGIAGATIGLRQLLGQFGLTPFPLTISGIALLGTCILAAFFGLEFLRLLTQQVDIHPTDLSSAFLRQLDLLLAKEQYEAVVRYHVALSRLLWVEGQLRVRIEIGKRIALAAAAIGDNATLMGVRIDDLGWTHVAIGNYDEARINIARGIELAEETGSHYWIAKGHRHLAGIAIAANESETANKEFALAREHAAQIESPQARVEMLAGIDYGEAQAALRANQLNAALALVDASERRRQEVGDQSRLVKVYALRGDIEERMGLRTKASESYQRGLSAAKKIGRIDEEIRCLMGLARIEKDPERKRELEQTASTLKAITPIPYDR